MAGRNQWALQIEADAFRARPGVPIDVYLGHVVQQIREHGWATGKESKISGKPSTAMAAWRAWHQIGIWRKDTRSSQLPWKADMVSPRSFDFAKAKEDLAIVREALVDCPERTSRQDCLLQIISSGHVLGRDIGQAAFICVFADRIRSSQLEEEGEDCF